MLVASAAAVTRVGVMVHFGSGVCCLGGIEQEAVLVLVVTEGTTTRAVLETVPAVLVTVVVTFFGVLVTVGDLEVSMDVLGSWKCCTYVGL